MARDPKASLPVSLCELLMNSWIGFNNLLIISLHASMTASVRAYISSGSGFGARRRNCKYSRIMTDTPSLSQIRAEQSEQQMQTTPWVILQLHHTTLTVQR